MINFNHRLLLHKNCETSIRRIYRNIYESCILMYENCLKDLKLTNSYEYKIRLDTLDEVLEEIYMCNNRHRLMTVEGLWKVLNADEEAMNIS